MLAQAKAHYEAGEGRLGGPLLQDVQMVVMDRRPSAYPKELYRWPIDPSLPELSEADLLKKGDEDVCAGQRECRLFLFRYGPGGPDVERSDRLSVGRRPTPHTVPFWAVAWIILFLSFSALLAYRESEDRRVASLATEPVRGRVVEAFTGRYAHRVQVEYRVGGLAFSQNFGYRPGLHIGSDVVVHFNSADPSVALIEYPPLPWTAEWTKDWLGRLLSVILFPSFFVGVGGKPFPHAALRRVRAWL